MAALEHHMILDPHRPFIVFNDDGTLTMEPVTADDLTPVAADDNFGRGCAWSSGCQFYFVVRPDGIALLDLNGDGWFCKKRSAMFFDLFLNAPFAPRRGTTRTLVRVQARALPRHRTIGNEP